MELEYVLLANHAEALMGGLVNMLGAGVRVFEVPAVPHFVPALYLVARISSTVEERDKTYSFSMEIHDPEGKIIPDWQAQGAFSPTSALFPELPDVTHILISLYGYEFSVLGIYKLVFRVRDLNPVELPILIHLRHSE